MKLAVVTNILAPYRVPLFEAMAKQVDDFTVFLMAKQEENRQWDVGPVPFKTELLKGVHFKPRSAEVSLHWNYGVLSALRRADPDVVMSGGFAPAHVEAYLYCKLYRKAYVGWGEFTLRDNARASALRRALRRWMTSGSAASVASSTEARDAFLYYGAGPHSVLTSLMPIDVDRFHREARRFRGTEAHAELRGRFAGPIILSVGRLTDRKGIPDLLAIYEQVVADRPDASLLLVGDGPDRGRYEAHVRERGWRRVHFVGFVGQEMLSRYLALADVFVFPTLADTYGAVLAEAMAAEVPVVSSIFAAATADLVVDGVNGYSVVPTVHAAAADRILEILDRSDEERAAMGRAGYEAVKSTDIEESAGAMVRFLRSIEAKRRLTGRFAPRAAWTSDAEAVSSVPAPVDKPVSTPAGSPARCPACGEPARVGETGVFDTRFGIPGAYSIAACGGCGLLLTVPAPSQSELAQLYERHYNYRDVPNSVYTAIRDWVLSSALYRLWLALDGDVSFYARRGSGRLLDVGCNEGRGLLFYKKNGFVAEGVEVSRVAAAAAARLGFPVHVGTLDGFDPPEPYDVVVLSNVLEHACDPAALLTHVRRVLKPGGMVWISCPNHQSWMRRLFGRYWINWHVPFHLVHFSPSSLAGLLERSGFRAVEIAHRSPALWCAFSVCSALFARPGRVTRQLRSSAWMLLLVGVIRGLGFPWLWIGNRAGRGDCLVATARTS